MKYLNEFEILNYYMQIKFKYVILYKVIESISREIIILEFCMMLHVIKIACFEYEEFF